MPDFPFGMALAVRRETGQVSAGGRQNRIGTFLARACRIKGQDNGQGISIDRDRERHRLGYGNCHSNRILTVQQLSKSFSVA